MKAFWIKERHNPQTGVYYSPQGRMSTTRAKQMEEAVYGTNVMLRFDSEEAYQAKLNELRREGHRIV